MCLHSQPKIPSAHTATHVRRNLAKPIQARTGRIVVTLLEVLEVRAAVGPVVCRPLHCCARQRKDDSNTGSIWQCREKPHQRQTTIHGVARLRGGRRMKENGDRWVHRHWLLAGKDYMLRLKGGGCVHILSAYIRIRHTAMVSTQLRFGLLPGLRDLASVHAITALSRHPLWIAAALPPVGRKPFPRVQLHFALDIDSKAKQRRC